MSTAHTPTQECRMAELNWSQHGSLVEYIHLLLCNHTATTWYLLQLGTIAILATAILSYWLRRPSWTIVTLWCHQRKEQQGYSRLFHKNTVIKQRDQAKFRETQRGRDVLSNSESTQDPTLKLSFDSEPFPLAFLAAVQAWLSIAWAERPEFLSSI